MNKDTFSINKRKTKEKVNEIGQGESDLAPVLPFP